MGRLTALGNGRSLTVCMAVNCPHAVLRHGDNWSHCEYDPKTRIELTPEFRNGPESNCAAGRWKGIEPIDVPALAAEDDKQSIAQEATRVIAFLKAFGGTIPEQNEAVRAELTMLKAAGYLSTPLAAKVETDLIADMEAASRAL